VITVTYSDRSVRHEDHRLYGVCRYVAGRNDRIAAQLARAVRTTGTATHRGIKITQEKQP